MRAPTFLISSDRATAEDQAIAASLRRHAEAARGAHAASTERALRADVVIFTTWCAEAGHAHLPATPETVAAFVDATAARRAPATVRRYVSSVAYFHRAAELANPCDTLTVKLALKRMHNARGRQQQQAGPLNDHLVVRMLQAAGTRLRDKRDKALLAVAYTTMCRRSELVGLVREDLQIDADGFGTVAIRRAKTDQEGRGDVAAITPDAMALLEAWLTAARIEGGPLFRSIRKGRTGRLGAALAPGHVALIFKRMARRALLSAEETALISGHSTRVGAAQDLVRARADMAGIMQAGRWKSPEMLTRYSRRLNAKFGVVAQAFASANRKPFK
jgi:integrase